MKDFTNEMVKSFHKQIMLYVETQRLITLLNCYNMKTNRKTRQ